MARVNRDRPIAFRTGLLERRPMLGVFCKSRDPAIVEALAHAGFQFAVVDLDHSTLTLGEVEQIVRAGDAVDLPVLVRLSGGSLSDAGRVLDSGAAGIQVTDIDSVAQALEWRAATRYRPEGTRGMAFSHRAAGYGAVAPSDHLDLAGRGTSFVAQIESRDGLAALPEMLTVPAVADALFLGPVDLAASLGHPGDPDHPVVAAALSAAAEQILAAGTTLGVFCPEVQRAAEWAERGATMIVVGSDMTLLVHAARQVTSAWSEAGA